MTPPDDAGVDAGAGRALVVVVNGREQHVADGTTLDEVVATVTREARGVAVAVDGHVVRRPDWGAHVVVGGAQVEVLTAVPGG